MHLCSRSFRSDLAIDCVGSTGKEKKCAREASSKDSPKAGNELVCPKQAKEVVDEHVLQWSAEGWSEVTIWPLRTLCRCDVGREVWQYGRGQGCCGVCWRVKQHLQSHIRESTTGCPRGALHNQGTGKSILNAGGSKILQRAASLTARLRAPEVEAVS